MKYSTYSSHLAVLEKVFECFKINSTLEFGMGSYSTPFMARQSRTLISVEQESQQWYDKVCKEITGSNFHPIYEPDPKKIFNTFSAADEKFDLVFSDGKADTRCMVANMAMELDVPIVLLHDTDQIWYYKWDRLRIPKKYSRFDFRWRTPNQKMTTVLTTHKSDFVDGWEVAEHDRVLQAYSSPNQPVIRIIYPGDNKAMKSDKVKVYT